MYSWHRNLNRIRQNAYSIDCINLDFGTITPFPFYASLEHRVSTSKSLNVDGVMNTECVSANLRFVKRVSFQNNTF